MEDKNESAAEQQEKKVTTLFPRPNGPLIISGDQLHLVSEDGQIVEQGTRFAICRCGHTAKQPFCDGSHNRMNFKG